MPRRIREFPLQSAQGGGQADSRLDKVVKYVPADVVAAWTAIVAIAKTMAAVQSAWVLVGGFAVGAAVTFWWTLKQTAEASQPPAWKQAIVAVVAFAVWVLALGDLDVALGSVVAWDPTYAKIILVGFTLISSRI